MSQESEQPKTPKKVALHTYHRFLDEAGDTTFYGAGKKLILGTEGVSKCFILGMLNVKEPLEKVRQKILALQADIAADPYYKDVPSIKKKMASHGYFLHAKDDIPEVRKQAFDLVASLKCSFQAVVARKIPSIHENKHGGKDDALYADLLSHLLKDKVAKYDKLVLNIAARGSCTSNSNLQRGLVLARSRYAAKHDKEPDQKEFVFNVQNPTTEPLLNVADYFCWAVQRVFEKGELRYYDFLSAKISTVIDLYDSANYSGYKNYYGPKHPLTKANAL
jgi:hypothetical protein